MQFSDLMASAEMRGETMRAVITDDWMQGRTTYGGLSAALCLETAMRAFPDAPPLRSALIAFIGPAGGAVSGAARLLRRGKSVTFAEAEVTGEKGLATRAVFAFGGSRPSRFDTTFTPPPDLPPAEDCPPFIPPEVKLETSFANHFENRLAKGDRPFSGSKEHDHYIWVRHRDARAEGVVALLALADMPPPAVLPMFTELAPISSMTWMVNVLHDAPQSRDGWWLLQSRAEQASEGYSSQDMLVWNSDMELMIAGRQSVAIFA